MEHEADAPLVSYAQNREDLYLWALLGHRTPGTYVDIGCNHEREQSVTRLFYDRNWSGLNIDADPKYGAEYRCRDRDRFLSVGIGAASGEMSFRIYPDFDGIATFDDEIKQVHAAAGHAYRDVTVQVRTLDEVLRTEGVDTVDFLKIDVEGIEPDVLRGLDLNRIRPAVIVLEASRVEECERILTANRYHREFFDGLNLYFADDDAPDINILNFAGRVLHNGYQTAREFELATELAGLRLGPDGARPDDTITVSPTWKRVAAAVHRRLRPHE
jgi:FkbM family methyltransferase